MNRLPVIAIFDIGKTNKKFLLFDADYKVVHEEEIIIPPIKDEDGDSCDDLLQLCTWIRDSFERAINNPLWSVKALNFSSFGASFVHLDKSGQPLTPLYSYLKPLPEDITGPFYSQFGEAWLFSFQTGSPVLNMLNSGIQLYWLKKAKPAIFEKLHYSLHLPQYLSYLFTGLYQADISSIGCHTGLWDIHQRQYHEWLQWENLDHLLPPAQSYNTVTDINYKGQALIAGIGMHDSSASLLPFTLLSPEPVGILSTGTWSITMLPSFAGTLEEEEYKKDCLYYLLGRDQPVAASRIFLGHEFGHQLKKLNVQFGKDEKYYLQVLFDGEMMRDLIDNNSKARTFIPETMGGSGPYPALVGNGAELREFSSFEQGYHKLLLDAAWLQKESIDLLIKKSAVKKIYVTGGFARNKLFVQMLAKFFPGIRFYTASVNNGSALGAALALHDQWNENPLAKGMVSLTEVGDTLPFELLNYTFMWE